MPSACVERLQQCHMLDSIAFWQEPIRYGKVTEHDWQLDSRAYLTHFTTLPYSEVVDLLHADGPLTEPSCTSTRTLTISHRVDFEECQEPHQDANHPRLAEQQVCPPSSCRSPLSMQRGWTGLRICA
jgi:hypothetical protein